MLTQDAKRGRMDVDEGNCQCHEMVSCEYSKTIDRTKENAGAVFCSRSIFDLSYSLFQPMHASQRAPCQPPAMALSIAIKAVSGELSWPKTRRLTSEDLPLIAVCLLGQSQDVVPRQRLLAIL